jgi:ubiquinone biosynthesis protein Coq4
MRHAVGGADLLCVYYEREMDKGLEQLRRELSIEPLFK